MAYYRFRISMDSKQTGSNRFPSILFTEKGGFLEKQEMMIYNLDSLNNKKFLNKGKKKALFF